MFFGMCFNKISLQLTNLEKVINGLKRNSFRKVRYIADVRNEFEYMAF